MGEDNEVENGDDMWEVGSKYAKSTITDLKDKGWNRNQGQQRLPLLDHTMPIKEYRSSASDIGIENFRKVINLWIYIVLSHFAVLLLILFKTLNILPLPFKLLLYVRYAVKALKCKVSYCNLSNKVRDFNSYILL